ncbi:MBL fold metallo-hydrolase [Nocardia vulneris]|uniref:Metallo-beta-lactamase domain-containing protein n=1 Tax=Nocardia vulneris TaxID=1141657 RepID=A0ABR4Z9P9_9NOCA|nr:MBL fold metallo-hydrolase [Nocardia vulneris]KIA61874.1 hypothetical protein FG87_28675 [Nocardia vulneris]
MKVHHLDCATMCPLGGRALLGSGGLLTAELVAHCLLVETESGLVLVDTGFGTAEIADPKRLGFGTQAMLRPALRLEQTALHQVRALGYQREDVRHIVVTHLDFDHAGGLADFPDATVHVFADELAAATARATRLEKSRYVPRQWAHGAHWQTHETSAESWFEFSAAPLLDGIVLVPLVGHTRGHSGVAVQQGERWLLHCGDAFMHRGQLLDDGTAPVGLKFYQRATDVMHERRVHNLERLRSLRAEHGDEITLFCAHDAQQLADLQTVS